MLILVSALPASGQGKIYTRKMRLADFPTKTTKIVLEGNSFLELTLREEIAVHWRISPFDFCDRKNTDASGTPRTTTSSPSPRKKAWPI